MYKPNSSVQQESADSLESKYTVAEILSSMTSGEPPITPVSFSSGIVPSFPTSATSMLTPTTLANLEQTFVDLSNQQQQQQQNPSISQESGFVPPMVNPIVIDPANIGQMGIKREYDASWDDDQSTCSSQDTDWGAGPSKRFASDPMSNSSLVPKIDPQTYLVANSRRPTGRRQEKRTDNLTVEEFGRKSQRRERNKVAAAKCRQRRVDQTNVLINETENLEEEKSQLEHEITSLQQQKEQLEFLLNAHKPMCKVPKCQLQHQHHHHQPQQTATATITQQPQQQLPTSTYMEAPPQPTMTTRPSSLPLRTTQALSMAPTMTSSSLAGIPITTPSSMFGNISLDTIMEGHTGLTPLTTQAPSCGSQVQLHRTSSDSSSEMGSPNNNSLISL